MTSPSPEQERVSSELSDSSKPQGDGAENRAVTFSRRGFLTIAARSVIGVVGGYALAEAVEKVSGIEKAAAVFAHALDAIQPKKEPVRSQEIISYSEYKVDDLFIFGESHALALVKLPDGQHVAMGELDLTNPDKRLVLKDIGKIPFKAAFASASEDGSKIVVGGSEASGVNTGKLWIRENGNWKFITQDIKGTVMEGVISTDNRYLVTREADPNSENGSVYCMRDLKTGVCTKLPSSANSPVGSIQGPITPTGISSNPTVYTSYGSAYPSPGYTENKFDLTSKTASITTLNPNEGYNRSKRLPQYTNSQGKHVVGIVNSDTSGPDGRRLATFFYNEGATHIPSMDRQPDPSLYAEANAGGGLNSITMGSAVADVIGDWLLFTTAVNVDNINHARIEVSKLSNPNAPHFLVEENGTWPKNGKSGDPSYFADMIYKGGERYFLTDVLSDTVGENGLRLKRITNGFNSTDVWQTVTVEQTTYKVFIPVVERNSKH